MQLKALAILALTLAVAARPIKRGGDDSGSWNNGSTKDTSAGSGTWENKNGGDLLRKGPARRRSLDVDLLKRGAGLTVRGGHDGSGSWNNGSTKDTSAGSGTWENEKGGDLLRRGGGDDSGTWNNGSTKDTSAGSGTWDNEQGSDLLRRVPGRKRTISLLRRGIPRRGGSGEGEYTYATTHDTAADSGEKEAGHDGDLLKRQGIARGGSEGEVNYAQTGKTGANSGEYEGKSGGDLLKRGY